MYGLIFMLVATVSALDSSPVTVVSGYWKLPLAKHTHADYKAWFPSTLALNAPMVFYYDDPEVLTLAQTSRGGLPTLYYKKSLQDFTLYRHFNEGLMEL